MKAPRIMLAAGRSGSGKTMITCGLLRALQQMGKQPAAFKCGPDYIDPMFHEQVIGAPSCNLDPFFTEEETTQYLFCKHAAGHDISVLEGVMGYYDGLGGISTKGSAYDLAGMTKTPVLLVVDAKGMSVSALAFIKGYLQYKEDSRIAGVIFNRMSEMLYREIAPMAEKELGISCVGFVPELKECHLESRHLGLVMPDEVENLQEQVNLLAETLQKTLDFEKILAKETSTIICSGTRAYDMALRLRYEGTEKKIIIHEDLQEAVDALFAQHDNILYAIATYTALLPTRNVICRRIK